GPHDARDGETLTGVKTSFGYDPSGNLATVKNALGQTLTLSGYDTGFGIPTTVDFNGAFQNTRTAFPEGWVKTETDGRRFTTSYDYDAIGRLKTVTPPAPN